MKKLFSEFGPAGFSDWEAQVKKELKGESPESLIWHNENGIDLRPYYTTEDLRIEYSPAFAHNNWSVCIKANGADADSNTELLQALRFGAESVFIDEPANTAALLKDVDLNIINSTFSVKTVAAQALAEFIETHHREARVTFIPKNISDAGDLKKWLLVFQKNSAPTSQFVSASVLQWHNNGCNASYEIALAFAYLLEFINAINGEKNKYSMPFVIHTAVGSDYFVQIAKFRAMRRLWEVLKGEFGLTNELYIITETSVTEYALTDSYNNILRSTVAAMAGILGGTNELIVHPFRFGESQDWFSRRMAISQQMILREECYLDKMADVSCGSYYIETLTDALAEKALAELKNIESAGGYFKSVSENLVSANVKHQAEDRYNEFKSGNRIMVGVNKYRNDKEQLPLASVVSRLLQSMHIHNPSLQFEMNKVSAS